MKLFVVDMMSNFSYYLSDKTITMESIESIFRQIVGCTPTTTGLKIQKERLQEMRQTVKQKVSIDAKVHKDEISRYCKF